MQTASSEFGLRIGYYTHPGQQRKYNEDSLLVLVPPAIAPGFSGLLAVADGMGGHNAGDEASGMVVDLLASLFTTQAFRERVTYYDASHVDYPVVLLKETLEWLNDQINQAGMRNSSLEGMGTTTTLLLFSQDHVFWGHVGDSRAYLLRGQSLQQMTMDHTWVNEQVATGQLTAAEAAVHPRRHVLNQSLGGGPFLRVERGMQAVLPQDRFLLCSDGLSNLVSESEIWQHLLSASPPQVICDKLGDLANQRGGYDNITVVVAEVAGAAGDGTVISGGMIRRPTTDLPDRHETQPAATLKVRRLPTGTMSRRCSHLVARAKLVVALAGGILLAVVLSAGVRYLPSNLLKYTSEVVELASVVLGFVLGALLGWLLRDGTPM